MIGQALTSMPSRAGLRSATLLALFALALGVFAGSRTGSSGAGMGARPVAAAEKESWLKKHEDQGGHTLARHVGKDEAWLRARLAEDPRLSRASSFPDVATAEKVIQAAAKANQELIAEWQRTGRGGARLTLDYEGRQKIGISVSRRSPQVFDCFRARIVLQAMRGNGYYILTAYPD